MSQQSELEKVKARIRALAARTMDRGCTEAEALAAAQKVGELLEVYGLSMSEVELRQETCIQKEMIFQGTQGQPLGVMFVPVIRLTETKGWMNGRYHFILFGLEPDVLMGEYLLHVVAGALRHEEQAFRSGEAFQRSRLPPQARLRSFRYGFAERVSERLDELARHREQAERAAPQPTGTALVVVKERIVTSAFRELGIRLRSTYSTRTIRDGAAYRQGAHAGGRVQLDRPVTRGREAPSLRGRKP